MTTLEQINKVERLLHAAKGRAQVLRNNRWIDQNYKGKPTDTAAIQQAETEITQHRQTLRNLYQTI